MDCEETGEHLPVYWCPIAGGYESPCHGGFDVCCDHPEEHQEVIDGGEYV